LGFTLLKKELGMQIKSTPSTNDYLKNPDIPFGTWVVAKAQTQGKGSKVRTWISLGSEPLFFSGKFQFPDSHFSLPLFSLFAGAALLRAIESTFPDLSDKISIKWPNDLYKEGKKIAGILIETVLESNRIHLIVGIGLNLFGSGSEDLPLAGFLLDRPILREEKEQLIDALVMSLNQSLLDLAAGSESMRQIVWIESRSYFRGRVLEWEDGTATIRAEFLGYDEVGFLVLRKESGEKLELMEPPEGLRIV